MTSLHAIRTFIGNNAAALGGYAIQGGRWMVRQGPTQIAISIMTSQVAIRALDAAGIYKAEFDLLRFLGFNDKENLLEKLGLTDEVIEQKTKLISEKIEELVYKAIGLTGILFVSNFALGVLSTYIALKLKHYVSRPALSKEYSFDNWLYRSVRWVKEHTDPITSFFYQYFYEKEVEPYQIQPIFNDEIQKQVNRIRKSIINIGKHNGYFSNLLLSGPPGTGKTMPARDLAKSTGMNFIVFSGGAFAQYTNRGEYIQEINDLFETVNAHSKPTIIFIDEADSLGRKRSELDVQRIELLNAFLGQTGSPSKKFMLIMATNRPQDLDPGVFSRVDQELEINPPATKERLKILQETLAHFFGFESFETFFTPDYLDAINEKLEGFTGRDIFKLCNALVSAQNAEDDNALTRTLADEVIEECIENHIYKKRFEEKEESSSLAPKSDSSYPPFPQVDRDPLVVSDDPSNVFLD